ncbi:MAG: cytochrome c [Gammaproteobacteria bacterium]|nr:cytochrome c [Gammaproteobacteria bacterium]
MKMKYEVLLTLVLMFLSGAVVADAGHEKMSNGHQSGSMSPGHWMAPEKEAERPNPVRADGASLARGKKLFQANCASCHGPTGRGDGPAGAALNPKPVDLAAMAGQHPDGDYAWKIAEGRGAMPAWKAVLSEKQIWDVVNYLQQGLTRPDNGSHMHGPGDHHHGK